MWITWVKCDVNDTWVKCDVDDTGVKCDVDDTGVKCDVDDRGKRRRTRNNARMTRQDSSATKTCEEIGGELLSTCGNISLGGNNQHLRWRFSSKWTLLFHKR